MTNPGEKNPGEDVPERILTPEEREREEEDARVRLFEKMHPELFAVPAEKREGGEEIAQFENLLASFEATYSLETLYSIVDLTPELDTLFRGDTEISVEQIASAVENLTPEDAEKYKLRAAADKALEPAWGMIGKLKKETNISPEKYNELIRRYMHCSRAVGVISNKKIDHTRKHRDE